MKRTLLLLEDDAILAETLMDLLEARGYGVHLAQDGEQALEACFQRSFDLMLLDVGVPKLDGFELLRELRTSGEETPALFISAKTDIASLAEGFEAGADDYIKKPFDFDELLIRIDSLLRKRFRTREAQIELGELSFRIASAELFRGDEPLPLPPAQARILDLLVRRRGEIVSKEALLQVLGEGEEASEGALRVHVSYLRKLGLAIETRKGIGYRLEAS
ncbi:response regulator transcription factor [Nitratifractor sp.]